MNDTFNGIILNQSEYKEKDLLIRVLTDTNQHFSLVMAGANQIKSKRASSSMPGSLIEFIIDYKEESTMYRVKSVQLVKGITSLYDDIYVLNSLQLILELANKLDDATFVYDELVDVINNISIDNYLYLSALFLSYTLRAMGLEPYVGGCVSCNTHKVSSINIEDGGFVCAIHSTSNYKYSLDDLKRFRAINMINFDNYLQYCDIFKWEINDIKVLVEFISYHSGIKLNSFQLLYNMLSND